ncbi:hypothetical protein BJ508DRAFT_75818 [Ascobolus immersus RN42]|uniref:Uncharacterized protein n=1 Tax=Ascobolus immersus RN42 TaxID=1160509 RepID=A0A3N4HFF0_ASCIM|nr:hypothetical protein BJ508DRAFT_75818 [Ascobolus immersus RN42]
MGVTARTNPNFPQSRATTDANLKRRTTLTASFKVKKFEGGATFKAYRELQAKKREEEKKRQEEMMAEVYPCPGGEHTFTDDHAAYAISGEALAKMHGFETTNCARCHIDGTHFVGCTFAGENGEGCDALRCVGVDPKNNPLRTDCGFVHKRSWFFISSDAYILTQALAEAKIEHEIEDPEIRAFIQDDAELLALYKKDPEMLRMLMQ